MNIKVKGVWYNSNGVATIVYKLNDLWVSWTVDKYVGTTEKELLNFISNPEIEKLFKERRKKHWAEEIGIKWMDGMPLTLEQIATFHTSENLKDLLDDMVAKGY